MKKASLVALFLLITAVAYGLTNEFVVTNFNAYTWTKGHKQVPVTPNGPVIFKLGMSNCQVFLNSSSATSYGYPIAANTEYKWQITSDTNALAFSCYSVPFATRNKVYIIK